LDRNNESGSGPLYFIDDKIHTTHTMKNTQNVNLKIFGIDTAIVLFFLAAEYARSVRILSADALLMATTTVMVLVLPYFLPTGLRCPSIWNWLGGRSVVLFAGLLAGAAFSQVVGTVLPEGIRLLPMTFLIAASMVSCYIQFYGLLKLRPAK
jgi:hypothetical protein